MRMWSITTLCIFLAIIHFLVFARNTGEELIVSPKSVIILNTLNPSFIQSKDSFLAIQSGSRVCFISEEHELVNCYIGERIAKDNKWVAVYRQNALELLEPTGQVVFRFSGSAYPIARDGNLYLYADDSGTLSKIDPANGALIWEKNYISQLTSINAKGERTLIGLLDGRIELIGSFGEILLSYKPGGSRIEAIYGTAISNDASRIALISGLEPQRFLILEERRGGFKPIHHHDTYSDHRRSISMGFIHDDSQVIYEGSKGIRIFDMNSNKLDEKDIPGRILRWIDNLRPGTLTLLEKNEKGTRIKMLTRNNLPIFDFSLPPESVDIIEDRNFIIITSQYDISVLEFLLE